ncbi:conserved hypothetical protein [Coccidioides posadasii str. Silveira]|uniref:Uncharacterized protein n=2 Tax=Coccidioides posadasii TaxID=199306 RepID=E9D5U6_COCPS|nr:conserved hypothetical protein [Coccidioides posadasii str. Silveira]KMM66327.1 hypothetical protein CPAG_02666 [Coccidioides posadasii RMSCC 3488]
MTARTPAPPSSLLSKINTAHLRKRYARAMSLPLLAIKCISSKQRGAHPEAEREAISGRATPPQSTITLRTMQGSEFDGLAKEAKQGGAVLFIPRHIYLRFKARREAEDPGDRECQALGLGGQTNHKSCVSSPAARWGYPDVEVGCYSDAIIWAAQPIKLPAAPP